jgi:RNA polymerase sigma-70 factor (ECF subfamily)
MTTAAEAAVVALAKLGDRPAFEELVRRRQSAVRNLLRRLCRDHALADDLAQQTFIQAWKTITNLQSPQAFWSWLRKIAVNSWLQQLRGHIDAVTDYDADVAAVTPVIETHGERIDLDHALMQLSPDVRLCIVLSHAEGMSHGEVAAATGLPLGTVKSHITRGTAALRNLLQAYGCQS